MLAELMRLKYGIAVAGMHGKTTTTSMIAAILASGGLDPTIVVGGRIDAMGSNARLGKSQYLVAEADESDRSFLKLSQILAVVTNLDREHMDCYRDMADVEAAFVTFMDRVPFYGAITACLDDPLLAAVLPRVRRRVYTYGFTAGADFVCRLLPTGEGARSRFEVVAAGQVLGAFTLHVPGRHNVLNSLAAVAVATELEIPDAAIQRALANFQGIDRRLQQLGEIQWPGGRALIVDDYGHHPTEVAATLEALRQGYPDRRLVLAFQPHRYTRTHDLIDDFGKVLSSVDVLLVTEVYAAGEAPIPGADGRAICRTVRSRGLVEPLFVDKVEDLAESLKDILRDGDVIVSMGAGNISAVAHALPERFAQILPPVGAPGVGHGAGPGGNA